MGRRLWSPAQFPLMASKMSFILAGLLLATLPGFAAAQVAQQAPGANPSAGARQGLTWAEHGNCKEALPLLRKSTNHLADKDLKRKAGLATVRCAMTLDRMDAALDAIQMLSREFPRDPEVLYLTTHDYSDLSTRASLELARIAPNSYQAHEMNAESLETQGKWDEAAAEYRKVLEQNAQLQGIHFRVGRLILSMPETPTTAEDARREFEAELRIDPNNAGAEYVLGELSRQGQQWDDAIHHFLQAVKADPSFSDAFLGLGMSYVSATKFAEALEPLEKYVRMQPGNPAGHYQLAIAYSRSGRKEDAKREAALQKEMADKIEQEKQKAADAVQKQSPSQEGQKPEPRS